MLLEYGNTIVNTEWKIDEKLPPGYVRVYYVYSGEVVYKDDKCTTSLKPQHLYIFPSAATYRMKQNTEFPLHCTFMHLDLFPILVFDLIEIQLERNALLKHMLESFSIAITDNDLNMIRALADVFELYCKEHNLIHEQDDHISKVLFYIADHVDEDIRIDDLSRLAGYNTQYFVRYFKHSVGLSPYQYVINYRLKEAIRLLKSNFSITHIAKATGYHDIKAFSRAFKKFYRISPSDFRKVYKIQP